MQKIAFLLSAFLVTNSAYAASASISTQTEVWFSPQGGARDAILESIAGAKKEIHVGAYKLEDKIIAQALVDAKDRGVEVSIILDKKKSKYKTSLKKWLVEAHALSHRDFLRRLHPEGANHASAQRPLAGSI